MVKISDGKKPDIGFGDIFKTNYGGRREKFKTKRGKKGRPHANYQMKSTRTRREVSVEDKNHQHVYKG